MRSCGAPSRAAARSLVDFARKRLKEQLIKVGATTKEIATAEEVLDPEVLTIGFARRFATYKRGTLLLRDLDRLSRILNNPEMPVQIIFAGKAHPQDQEGKELIRQIVQASHQERFRHRIVFIEDYDMEVARHLVQGVDVWLNTPLRPMEASGTSGMKVAFNGGLNMSVLDGWWCEGYQGNNGWAIGKGEVYEDIEYQNQVESRAIYDLLEKEVVPLLLRPERRWRSPRLGRHHEGLHAEPLPGVFHRPHGPGVRRTVLSPRLPASGAGWWRKIWRWHLIWPAGKGGSSSPGPRSGSNRPRHRALMP